MIITYVYLIIHSTFDTLFEPCLIYTSRIFLGVVFIRFILMLYTDICKYVLKCWKTLIFQATNVIPSISAVTGITPGAYFWRICIGLHATPRFAVGFMYYSYYAARLAYVDKDFRPFFKKLLSLNFWLYTIENSCLVGVTYISNKENYRKYSLLDIYNYLI